MTPILEEIRAQLTGPGAPFETAHEDVLGERMLVFKQRARSLRELLQRASLDHADKEYLVHDDRRITYAAHERLVASVAAALKERYGLEPGDRVAILAANRLEWIVSFWATVSLGGIVACLNAWWTADEILYGVELSEPKLLIGDAKRLSRVPRRALRCGVLEIEGEFGELERFSPDAKLPDQAIPEDAPAVILFTSGTTGRPKGAVNSHRGIIGFVQTNVTNGVERMLVDARSTGKQPQPPSGQTIALVTPPLFHLSGLYGLTVLMLTTGGKLVLRSGRFDAGEVLRLMQQERVTQWSALGSSGPRVASHPDVDRFDLSSVTHVGFGGAPASPALQQRMREVFPASIGNVGMGYGSSETTAIVASIGGEEFRQHPESCGRPPITIEAEIRDPEGRSVPDGVEGEIHTRSPYIMLEYWRDPVATAETIRPGRWLATGDIGRFEDGLLYINSRARDMILRSAENVYPVEIEYRLEAHPGVREAAVVGVDHPELGQEVKAIVVPEADAGLDTAELADFCAQTLAAFKVPTLWEIRSEPLPRNAAGKMIKTDLTGETKSALVEE